MFTNKVINRLLTGRIKRNKGGRQNVITRDNNLKLGKCGHFAFLLQECVALRNYCKILLMVSYKK